MELTCTSVNRQALLKKIWAEKGLETFITKALSMAEKSLVKDICVKIYTCNNVFKFFNSNFIFKKKVFRTSNSLYFLMINILISLKTGRKMCRFLRLCFIFLTT